MKRLWLVPLILCALTSVAAAQYVAGYRGRPTPEGIPDVTLQVHSLPVPGCACDAVMELRLLAMNGAQVAIQLGQLAEDDETGTVAIQAVQRRRNGHVTKTLLGFAELGDVLRLSDITTDASGVSMQLAVGALNLPLRFTLRWDEIEQLRLQAKFSARKQLFWGSVSIETIPDNWHRVRTQDGRYGVANRTFPTHSFDVCGENGCR